MVTFSEIVCATQMMRLAQKKYFKTRDKKDLYSAWHAEKQVDELLEQCFTTATPTPPGSAHEITPGTAVPNSQTEPAPDQPDSAFPETKEDDLPFPLP